MPDIDPIDAREQTVRIDKMLTEIERLRAALKEIRDNGYRAALCHAVAKTALEQKSP
jgi:hypothetical protein